MTNPTPAKLSRAQAELLAAMQRGVRVYRHDFTNWRSDHVRMRVQTATALCARDLATYRNGTVPHYYELTLTPAGKDRQL